MRLRGGSVSSLAWRDAIPSSTALLDSFLHRKLDCTTREIVLQRLSVGMPAEANEVDCCDTSYDLTFCHGGVFDLEKSHSIVNTGHFVHHTSLPCVKAN